MIITDKTHFDEFGNYEFEFSHLGIDAPPNATPEYIKELKLADNLLWMEKQMIYERFCNRQKAWFHDRERSIVTFIEGIVQSPDYRIYKADNNFFIYEKNTELSLTLEEYIKYIFEEVRESDRGWSSLVAKTICESYFSKRTPIVEGRNQ
jgi:hypothetical protein